MVPAIAPEVASNLTPLIVPQLAPDGVPSITPYYEGATEVRSSGSGDLSQNHFTTFWHCGG